MFDKNPENIIGTREYVEKQKTLREQAFIKKFTEWANLFCDALRGDKGDLMMQAKWQTLHDCLGDATVEEVNGFLHVLNETVKSQAQQKIQKIVVEQLNSQPFKVLF